MEPSRRLGSITVDAAMFAVLFPLAFLAATMPVVVIVLGASLMALRHALRGRPQVPVEVIGGSRKGCAGPEPRAR